MVRSSRGFDSNAVEMATGEHDLTTFSKPVHLHLSNLENKVLLILTIVSAGRIWLKICERFVARCFEKPPNSFPNVLCNNSSISLDIRLDNKLYIDIK